MNENTMCIIDGETRKIFVPKQFRQIGVESDEKVTRIQFTCPKIVGDGIDLTTMNLYVNYQNANGDKNMYSIEDVVTNGDSITFSWLLSRHVTEYKGTVYYVICAKKSIDGDIILEWNTKVTTGQVNEGLECERQVEEIEHDVIEQILVRLADIPTKVSELENDEGYLVVEEVEDLPTQDVQENVIYAIRKTENSTIDVSEVAR